MSVPPLIDDTPGKALRGFTQYYPPELTRMEVKELYDLKRNVSQIVKKLEAELVKAKTALRNYGGHKSWCSAGISPDRECDCGWVVVLRDAKEVFKTALNDAQ